MSRSSRKQKGPDPETPRELLTIGEASEILRVHSNTLRRWCERGLIRTYRIGPRRDRRFRAEDIQALFAGRAERDQEDTS